MLLDHASLEGTPEINVSGKIANSPTLTVVVPPPPIKMIQRKVTACYRNS